MEKAQIRSAIEKQGSHHSHLGSISERMFLQSKNVSAKRWSTRMNQPWCSAHCPVWCSLAFPSFHCTVLSKFAWIRPGIHSLCQELLIRCHSKFCWIGHSFDSVFSIICKNTRGIKKVCFFGPMSPSSVLFWKLVAGTCGDLCSREPLVAAILGIKREEGNSPLPGRSLRIFISLHDAGAWKERHITRRCSKNHACPVHPGLWS